MDKSTLLNEIVNHANFKQELINALCGDDTIKDHFYSYDFNEHYTHFDICDELRDDLIKALCSNLDCVKSTFLKVFNDASFCELYEFLACLEGSWGYDFNELIGSSLDDCLIDAFKDIYSEHKSYLIQDFKSHIFEFIDGDDNTWYFSANPKLRLAIDSVINDHVDNFECETDIFASVFNCGGVVCGLNALMCIEKDYHEIETKYLNVFINMLCRARRDVYKVLDACEVD